MRFMASRMAAKSTTAGTPVKSWRRTRAGVKAISLAGSAVGFQCARAAKMCAEKAQQIFGGYGLTTEFRISRYKCYADLMFVGEGPANVQKILIAEDALGYKVADRHHGATGLREKSLISQPLGSMVSPKRSIVASLRI